MKLALYRFLTTVSLPVIRLYLRRRLAHGREDRVRFGERFGRASRSRVDGLLVWMHGASVGEALSMLPVIDWLRTHRADLNILVTTGTVTSARLLSKRLPLGVVHQYVPVDRPAWVRRFFDYWRPDHILWFESELWPNMLLEGSRRGVPMTLVNGRMSLLSWNRWRRHPAVIRTLLRCFGLCLGQTEADAGRFRALGAANVDCSGNLKLAAKPLPADETAYRALQAAIAGRPVWVASSTHAGEEAMSARIHVALAARTPDLLTIIVPRHPRRGREITQQVSAFVQRVVRRGEARDLPGAGDNIYVADTVGELGLFYRCADVVFIGKSMTGHGGQNPVEPAHFSKPVLFGPNMQNFAEIAGRMLATGAARQVHDEMQLTDCLGRLLASGDERRSMGQCAAAFAGTETAVLDNIMAVLVDRIPEKMS